MPNRLGRYILVVKNKDVPVSTTNESLKQLKEQYADLLDESTVGRFPYEPYKIPIDQDVTSKKTAPIKTCCSTTARTVYS